MTDWNIVRCTECGIMQDHPSNPIIAFKCKGCEGGSWRPVEDPAAELKRKQKTYEEEKIAVKEPVGEGFMCEVQCKNCLTTHLWSQLALNNAGFVCNHNLCRCRDYALVDVEKREKRPDENFAAQIERLQKKKPFSLQDIFIDYCPDCNTVNEVKELSDTTVCPMCHHNMKRKRLMDKAKEPVGLRSTAPNIDHPEHYTGHPSGVECITVTEHFNFNLGNAMKYIWRAGLKGRQVEDLEKAAWYIAREIARLGDKYEDAKELMDP